MSPALLVQQLLRAIFTIWLVMTIVFLVGRLASDPLQRLLPEDAGPEIQQQMREELGLDRPILEQYVAYFAGVFRGDFGNSYYQARPVVEMFAERVGPTLQLSVLILITYLAIGTPLGIIAAVFRNTLLDRALMSAFFVFYALPGFVLAITLILIFSFHLGVLPSFGRGGWQYYVMPVLAGAISSAAGHARLVRSSLLDVLRADYMRTARSKGVHPVRVVLVHGLRNSLLPVITYLGMRIGGIISGSVVLETVFAWPGVGRLLVSSVKTGDFPMVQFAMIVIAAAVVIANLITDYIYSLLDPRIRVS